MAKLSSTAPTVADKSHTESIQLNLPPVVGGLVQHVLLSPSTQVQILAVVDATGTATISDIVAELPTHADPVGAIFALIAAGIIEIVSHGVIDANSIVTRTRADDYLGDGLGRGVPAGDDTRRPLNGAGSNCSQPEAIGTDPTSEGRDSGRSPIGESEEGPPLNGLHRLQASSLRPRILVGSGEQRSRFRYAAGLDQPGVYILLNCGDAYVGFGADVGARIASGRQMGPERPHCIVAIADASKSLSADEARALERMLWSYVAADSDYTLINVVPDGAAIQPERYDQLSLFVAEVVLTLRQAGLMFMRGPARERMAGPRAEPDRIGAPRRIDDLPEGRVMELNYSGLTAIAAERDDGSWLLLRGSDVRLETVISANASASYLRSAWAHSGLIELARDGSCYMVKRDLIFSSGTAVGHFVSGSKGYSVSAWRPLDEGADEPGIPAA
jgi:hypothetical protein